MSESINYVYGEFFTPQKLRELERVRAGRSLILQDIDVRKRTFLDSSRSEAIIVDLDDYTEVYEAYLNEAVERARDESGRLRRYAIPRAVYETVAYNMRYSVEGVDKISEQKEDALSQGINIAVFMQERVGRCSHMAATCALMLETFKTGRFIHGQVSVDTNKRWNPENESEVLGHAWARLKLRDGRIFILDAAQRYFGTLEDSIESAKWSYLRPEEREQYENEQHRKVGLASLKSYFQVRHEPF